MRIDAEGMRQGHSNQRLLAVIVAFYFSVVSDRLAENWSPIEGHSFAFVSIDFSSEESALNGMALVISVNGTAITIDPLL